jgi:hypothetical protein
MPAAACLRFEGPMGMSLESETVTSIDTGMSALQQERPFPLLHAAVILVTSAAKLCSLSIVAA